MRRYIFRRKSIYTPGKFIKDVHDTVHDDDLTLYSISRTKVEYYTFPLPVQRMFSLFYNVCIFLLVPLHYRVPYITDIDGNSVPHWSS